MPRHNVLGGRPPPVPFACPGFSVNARQAPGRHLGDDDTSCSSPTCQPMRRRTGGSTWSAIGTRSPTTSGCSFHRSLFLRPSAATCPRVQPPTGSDHREARLRDRQARGPGCAPGPRRRCGCAPTRQAIDRAVRGCTPAQTKDRFHPGARCTSGRPSTPDPTTTEQWYAWWAASLTEERKQRECRRTQQGPRLRAPGSGSDGYCRGACAYSSR
jgi:hypothetical protein